MSQPSRGQPPSRVQAQVPSPTFMRLPYTYDYEALDIAIVGIPWDGGTSVRVGSRRAPREIREMSVRLHRLHPTYGVSPLDLCVVGDVGDAPVYPFDQSKSLESVAKFFRQLAECGVAPVIAGGDHLATLPVLRGIVRDRPVALVHFDAHCDTADFSAEGERFAASTPFRRAIEEGLVDPKRVVQIGLRESLRSDEKMRWARSQGVRQITMDEIYDCRLDEVIQEMRRVVGDHPTYVTFDIDGLDPAFAPGTGTPVIGGLTTYQAQRLLRGLLGLNIVGGDVMEVSPPYDFNNCTALVGASLMYELLCLIATKEGLGTAAEPRTDIRP